MSSVQFDTHKFVKDLMATGFTEQQAEVLADGRISGDLATKQDIEGLRVSTKADIEGLRVSTKADIDALRVETKADIDGVKKDIEGVKKDIEGLRLATEVKIKEMENRLIIWNIGAVGVGVAVLKLIL